MSYNLVIKGDRDMSNFAKFSATTEARAELHDVIGLTGAEVSINNLPAGAGVPFFHKHKKNEEIYVIISGKGSAIIDDETIELNQGDVVRVSPAAVRKFSAAEDTGISFACIQVRENSLEEYTDGDAEMA